MDLPKIFIVIPSYNISKYIDQTLRSIVDQDYPNYEVLVQDGGSKDSTIDIVEKYSKKYPKNIKFVSKKDDGQLDAINKGLSKASGEIITFINGDDVYEKGTFKAVSSYYIENPGALWFVGRCRMINENGQEIAKFWTVVKNMLLSLNSYFVLLFTSNYISQPSTFLTLNAYKKYGPFTGNKKFIYEYDMWLKLGKVKMPVVIKKTLSSFRITQENKSSVMYDDLFEFDINVIKKHTNNKIALYLHKLNNLVRVVVRKLI